MTPEAMRRLADLQLEKEYGIRTGGAPREMACPRQRIRAGCGALTASLRAAAPVAGAAAHESDQEFERRATRSSRHLRTVTASRRAGESQPCPAAAEPAARVRSRRSRSISKLLTEYPNYEHSDKVLYQNGARIRRARGTEEAMETMERLIGEYGNSEHFDEVQFRRGEYFFTRDEVQRRRERLSAIIALGAKSSYYELALYKLGWTFYKQEFYEDGARHSTWRCSTTRCRSATTSIRARGGGRTPRRGHVSRHQPELLATSAAPRPSRSTSRRPGAAPTRTASTAISASTI